MASASAYSAASIKSVPLPVYAGSWDLHSPLGERDREDACLAGQRLHVSGPAVQSVAAAFLVDILKSDDFDQSVKDDAAQQAAWDSSQDSLRSSDQAMLARLPVPTAPGQAHGDSLVIDWPDGADVAWAQIPDYNGPVRTFLDQRAAKEADPTSSYPDVVVPADQPALDKAKAIVSSSTDPLLTAAGGLRDKIANSSGGHYATDAADIAEFVTIGGFPQSAPDPSSLEFRTDVEAIKARWASCTSSNPWDPRQVLGGEVQVAQDEWEDELESQKSQRDDIVNASIAAAADLQKANDAMADAMAQAYIAQRITVIERYIGAHSTPGPPPTHTICTWSTCSPDAVDWVAPIANRTCDGNHQSWCDLIPTMNADMDAIGRAMFGDLSTANSAQADAVAKADQVSADEATAGDIAKANNTPYGRGLAYALQSAQVTKASAAAATAAGQAGLSAWDAAKAGASDAMTLWALSDTRAHAVQAQFSRAEAEEAAAQAHAAAGAAAAQATAAAASATAVHTDRVTAEAALSAAQAKAAVAKAKRTDADTQAATAASARGDAAYQQSAAAQAEATARTQQDIATKAHQDADTAAAQAADKQKTADAAEQKAADDRYAAQQAQAADDAAKAKAAAFDAQAQALAGSAAAAMAKSSADQADTDASTASNAAATAQSAADASTTAAQAARADATRAAGAAAKAKSDASAADAAAAGSRSAAANAHAAAADAIKNAAAAANNVAQATTDATAAENDAATALNQAGEAARDADAALATANKAAGYAAASADYATSARDATHAVAVSAGQAVFYGTPYQRSDATAGLAVLVANNATSLSARQDAAAAAAAADAARAATDAHNLATQASADAKAAATAADSAASDALSAQNSLVATRASASAASADAAATQTADKAAAAAAAAATSDASAAGRDASSAAADATAAANSASAAEKDAAGAHAAADDASAQATAAQAAAKAAQDSATAAATAAANAAADAAAAEKAAEDAEARVRAENQAAESVLDTRYGSDQAAADQQAAADLLSEIPPDRLAALRADIQMYMRESPNDWNDPTSNANKALMVRVRWAIEGNLSLTEIWDAEKGQAVGLLVSTVGLALCPESAGATCLAAVGAISGAAAACVEDCSDVKNVALQAVVSAALMAGSGKAADILASTIAKRITDDEVAAFVSACVKPHSFAAGTGVRMADGTVEPIQDIRVGDEISNATPGAAETEQHRVEQVHTTFTDTDFTDLTVQTPDGEDTVTGTQNHPYYDLNAEAFIDASKLGIGDKLQSTSGAAVTVLNVRNYISSMVTYDLTIEGLHTYYVVAGTTSVLVHNDSCRDGILAKLPARPGNNGPTVGIAVTDGGVELPMVDSSKSGDPSYPALARRVSDRLRQWNLLQGAAVSARAYDVEQTVAAMMLNDDGTTAIKSVNLVINNATGPCMVELGCNMALPYILNDDQTIFLHWKDATGKWRTEPYRGLNKTKKG
ncbi:hypothetical protein KGQ19_01215 [Catenulispora sp. NL8]|uniref:RING-type E3 ubiquitin transferase n=1 Tax=Catenulispora pinistramenti TaxID=2705254 RepID=A0ABS5KJ33_9ACTN|nr:polymorphic toxin-type HINT domain-containing protein [Catenulispora pinistramenti]MBS2545479.1 hypothetical protein [Catenulispora pinistramenti]